MLIVLPTFLRIDLINKMSLLIQAVLNMTSKKKRKSSEKKRVTTTYKFTDLRSKLTPQESFLGVWGQRLKQEQRKKMGGSKKRRLADRDGHLFTNFPLGSNPCSLRSRPIVKTAICPPS